MTRSSSTEPCRLGKWLPQDPRLQRRWLHGLLQQTRKTPQVLCPVLQDFDNVVKRSTRLFLTSHMMFDASSCSTSAYDKAWSFGEFLQVLNRILISAPQWSDYENDTGMIGCPMTVLFDAAFQNEAGFAFFQDPEANVLLKKILNAWSQYLSTSASAVVLNKSSSGWLGQSARHHMTTEANAPTHTNLSFEDVYQCDPYQEHHGFKSWDDFFTRRFCDGVRPVASPEDDSIVVNMCESKPYKIAQHVQERDKFWLKGHPYSILDMLAFDDLAYQFVGGTVYQAYLSALAYHRWHSPVSGTIRKTYVKDGTYFSKPIKDPWFLNQVGDIASHDNWEGFIAATATRALIFIEADCAEIGLICVMPIGMCEVSTCEVTVQENQHVQKGEEIGMFHYGGSSHCVLFRKDVNVKFFPDMSNENNVPVCGKLAKLC